MKLKGSPRARARSRRPVLLLVALAGLGALLSGFRGSSFGVKNPGSELIGSRSLHGANYSGSLAPAGSLAGGQSSPGSVAAGGPANSSAGGQQPAEGGSARAALPPSSLSTPYSILAVVATFDDDLSWLLEEPPLDVSGGPAKLIVPTDVYQVAELGPDCEPTFPALRRHQEAKKSAEATDRVQAPAWPDWAQAHIDRKCSARNDEVEPWSDQDEERAAVMAAGMSWNGRAAPEQLYFLPRHPVGGMAAKDPGFGSSKAAPTAMKPDAAAWVDGIQGTAAADGAADGAHDAAILQSASTAGSMDHSGVDSEAVLQGLREGGAALVAAQGGTVDAAAAGEGAAAQNPKRPRQRRLQLEQQEEGLDRDQMQLPEEGLNASPQPAEQPPPPQPPPPPPQRPGAAPSSAITLPDRFPQPLNLIPVQGRESLAYLSAIIAHYPEMKEGRGPALVVCMHGHRFSWHTLPFGQDWGLKRLRALGPRNITQGYMQLGCLYREESKMFTRVVDANHYSANGPRWRESMAGHFMQAWLEPGGLGEIFGEPLPPPYIQAGCCASFAVTRDAILRRPLSFYQALRKWLMRTNMEKYWPGIALEFSWHLIFTGAAVFDPSVEQCRKELYDL